MAKGQAEIVVVVGIVIVAAVVILYAVQSGIFVSSEVPGAVRQKYDSVKASLESLVRDGSQETMRKLSTYGGYLDNSSFQMGSVEFLGKEVPYWQYNGQVKYPNVQENFRTGLRDYLSRNKETVAEALKMSGVEFGEPQVSVNFMSSKIVVTVNMLTTIDDNKISKPYVVEVQTRLNEINEFSKAFAAYDKEKRPLEYYTLSSMMMSPMEQDVHTVPIFIFLTDCGDYVFKSWWDVKPAMEDTIKATLANVYMPGKAPTNFMGSSSSPKYTLVPLNGKRYESLDVTFHLPDNFQLSQSSFRFSPDPISAIANMIPMVGQCQSDPVYVNYYLSYPSIVRVKDPDTQNIFQFALDVMIKDNKPAEWTASGYGSDIQAQICANPQCSAQITVKSASGNPVDSASVSFMGCQIGQTNDQGALSAAAPCGIGPLRVYREGYEMYSQMQSSDNLRGLSLTVPKTPAVRLHFYEVTVENMSLSGKYQILDNSVNPLAQGESVYMVFQDTSGKTYQAGYNTQSALLNVIPAGDFVVTATLLSKADELGAIIMKYSITEDMDGKDLYIYLPSTSGYKSITDTAQKASAAASLTGVLYKCGYGPVAVSEVNVFKGCSVGYNEV
jgi:hypothetical protein